MHHKVSVIGGGGVRTPLLIHGLLQSQSLLASLNCSCSTLTPGARSLWLPWDGKSRRNLA